MASSRRTIVVFNLEIICSLIRYVDATSKLSLLMIPEQCLESAKGVVISMVEELAPSGYMRYAPDGAFSSQPGVRNMALT